MEDTRQRGGGTQEPGPPLCLWDQGKAPMEVRGLLKSVPSAEGDRIISSPRNTERVRRAHEEFEPLVSRVMGQ